MRAWSTVRTCAKLVCKAHVKLCKSVPNDSQIHMVLNYDIGYLGFLPKGERSNSSAYRLNCAVDHCTINVSYNFVTTYNLPKPTSSQDKRFINASLRVLALSFCLKVAGDLQHGRIQVLHRNTHCEQSTIKYMAIYTHNVRAHRGITVLSEIPGMLGD